MLYPESIKKLKPEAKPKKHYDSGGLFVMVTPKGAKSFRFKYHFAGKEKTLTFGLFPTVTLSQARNYAEDARRLLAQGVDCWYALKIPQKT